jgi:hypothetical protein
MSLHKLKIVSNVSSVSFGSLLLILVGKTTSFNIAAIAFVKNLNNFFIMQ